ncbi:hypothetical protein [Methylotuvimicrobium sp. KM1]|uniref:hypothetical protein n=1 Tax=Methylotuvimicrobium sp. KM1 TaxID=3377707 RepID=UPI00384D3C1B
MITDEIMITMAATLSTTLIIMLLAIRNTVHKKRLRRNLDWLETAKHSKYDTAHFQELKNDIDPTYINSSNSSTATFKLSLKISFGIAVLLGFSWWTFQLFTKDVLIWAALSGLFAVIGLVLPFLIWREVRQREEIKSRAGRILKQIEKNLKESHAEILKQNRKPSIASTTSITESAPAKETTTRVKQKIPVPEDSVLRRHLLSQLRAEVEATLFPRPTDCVLLRHYEQLVESEVENRLLNPEALQRFKFIDGIEIAGTTDPASIIDVKAKSRPIEHAIGTPSKSDSKHEIPEDSVLRRHWLTQLRSEIEASLFPRPTDCVLQRHYEQLVESELENRLVNPEDLSLFKFIDGRESALDSTAPPKPKRIDTLITKPASKAKNEPEQITIPEDSVLQRHFISHLRSEIETEVYPRPTEATLQRHYDQLIEAELASHLKWNTNWIR